jgi:hypothetical protein
MKRTKKKLIGFTIIAWAIIIGLGAYLYALLRARSPIAEPVFVSMWGWHLLTFAIFVLPPCLLVLIFIIWLEHRFIKED